MTSKMTKHTHAGETLGQIVFDDPAYFKWAIDHKMFFDAGEEQLQAEAEEIWLKIRNIKIPKPDPENWLVAYLYLDEGFNDIRLVPRLDPPHTTLETVLDMGFACQFDWMENLMLAKLIKRILFGGFRPSRRRINNSSTILRTFISQDQSHKKTTGPSAFQIRSK